jgi:hypothetical protein|tara:strand:- start:6719 stop:6964 length:246 start_codon:yes stop_codon:yes gene_type:complete
MNYNRGMDISTLINAVTGQFGALVLACVVLYNFMQQQKMHMERLYKDNKEDRELYRTTLTNLSQKIDKIGEDVAEIKKDLR